MKYIYIHTYTLVRENLNNLRPHTPFLNNVAPLFGGVFFYLHFSATTENDDITDPIRFYGVFPLFSPTPFYFRLFQHSPALRKI